MLFVKAAHFVNEYSGQATAIDVTPMSLGSIRG
jgi:hypothetical protein